MGIPVFVSHPKPCNSKQSAFIERLSEHLESRRIHGRTLGVGDYDMKAPLAGTRRIMLECNGVLVVAFARYEIKNGRQHFQGEDGTTGSQPISGKWLTSPWCQIEAGMGFQLGLPMLILREREVLPDGVLQHGVLGAYMPEFNLSNEPDAYFGTAECQQLLQQFESQVFQYRDRKGIPEPRGW
jgi:hypothetical protein